MMPEHRVHLEDEPCPVADQMIGEMYRASAQGLSELIATVSANSKGLACCVLLSPRAPCIDRTGDRGEL